MFSRIIGFLTQQNTNNVTQNGEFYNNELFQETSLIEDLEQHIQTKSYFLTHIPAEVHLLILLYLPIFDISHGTGLTCQFLNTLTDKNILWHSLCYRDIPRWALNCSTYSTYPLSSLPPFSNHPKPYPPKRPSKFNLKAKFDPTRSTPMYNAPVLGAEGRKILYHIIETQLFVDSGSTPGVYGMGSGIGFLVQGNIISCRSLFKYYVTSEFKENENDRNNTNNENNIIQSPSPSPSSSQSETVSKNSNLKTQPSILKNVLESVKDAHAFIIGITTPEEYQQMIHDVPQFLTAASSHPQAPVLVFMCEDMYRRKSTRDVVHELGLEHDREYKKQWAIVQMEGKSSNREIKLGFEWLSEILSQINFS